MKNACCYKTVVPASVPVSASFHQIRGSIVQITALLSARCFVKETQEQTRSQPQGRAYRVRSGRVLYALHGTLAREITAT